MLRKLVSTYLLVAMTATGTLTLAARADAAPMARTVQTGAPAAPVAPVRQAAAPAAAPLTVAQMRADRGGSPWGWLKKFWNKHKKTIIKIIWTVIKEIIDTVVTSSSSYQQGIVGTVTETYDGSDQTEQVYASQADYDAGQMQSSSYTDNGYAYVGTDYSAGYYEY